MVQIKFRRGFRWSLLVVALWLVGCSSDADKEVSDNDTTSESGPVVVVQQPVDIPVGEVIPLADQRVIPTEEIKPYRPNGVYASVLAECALVSHETPCTLGELPYLGQGKQNLTVDDVMQRVLVTHDWMGVRFEEMLRVLPADILQLWKPVTSIVIGSEVRPSSFSISRARVRLDPNRLWLSVDEKRTIATNADPRSDFGSELQFDWLWRYTLQDEYAWYYWSLTNDSERTIADIELPLAKLLYHELAHANDYVQPGRFIELTSDMTPADSWTALEDTRVSKLLYDQESLTAQNSYLYGLAGVAFFDDPITDFQRTLQADFVGAEMASEGKTAFYSYATSREDVAMLFEATMMKYHYGVDLHLGFTNIPDSEDPNCDDYIVAWGERNRLASALVVPRAKFVVDKISPSGRLNQFFETELGQAQPLRTGEGWCASRFSTSSNGGRASGESTSMKRTASGNRLNDDLTWNGMFRHEPHFEY